jgi:hypothetical protein
VKKETIASTKTLMREASALSSKVNFQDGQVLAIAVASPVVPFCAAVVHAASVVTMRAPTTRCAATSRIHSCGTVVERSVVSVVATLCRALVAQVLHRPRVVAGQALGRRELPLVRPSLAVHMVLAHKSLHVSTARTVLGVVPSVIAIAAAVQVHVLRASRCSATAAAVGRLREVKRRVVCPGHQDIGHAFAALAVVRVVGTVRPVPGGMCVRSTHAGVYQSGIDSVPALTVRVRVAAVAVVTTVTAARRWGVAVWVVSHRAARGVSRPAGWVSGTERVGGHPRAQLGGGGAAQGLAEVVVLGSASIRTTRDVFGSTLRLV